LKLSDPQPQRTPERQKLFDAITARAAADQAFDAMKRAIVRAMDGVAKAEARLADAGEVLVGAREQRAAELAAAAASGAPSAAGCMRQLRVAESEAQDELDAARAAHAKLVARLGTLEDEARAAGNLVVALADAVIRSPVKRVLADAVDAAVKLQRARLLLRFMQRPEMGGKIPFVGLQPPVFGEDGQDAVRAFGKERADRRATADKAALELRERDFGEVADAVKRRLDSALQVIFEGERQWSLAPELGPWIEAREALMRDADAALPLGD
jgi:hypothetical protein